MRVPVAPSVAVLGIVLVAPASGADRLIRGELIDVRDPSATEASRRVVIVGRESATDVPGISDPTAGGRR